MKPIRSFLQNRRPKDIICLTQQSWIRALDSKFKIYSKKLTNFRICYKALKIDLDYTVRMAVDVHGHREGSDVAGVADDMHR